MKFYLSSYRMGNEAEKLKKMVGSTNKRVAYISNALDFSKDQERRKRHEKRDIQELKNIGLNPELLDLQNYFGNTDALQKKLQEYGVLWVSGGNTFVLRQAMHLSGFDEAFKQLQNTDMVYGGYSAGACVLAQTLEGLHIVDNPDVKPYGEEHETIWEGLGILEYSIAPHYKSDHPESEDIDKEIQYCIDHNIPYKTLRDGEVIIIE